MSEQNINNIIGYLNENTDQSTATLVQSLINAGYPIDDIKAALIQLGISPLVIPGYKETMQPAAPTTSIVPGRAMIAGVGAVIILIGVYYIGNTNLARMLTNIPFLGRKPELAHPQVEQKTPSITPSPTITEIPEIDPFAEMKKKIEAGSYKITINQTIQDETVNTMTYYVKNGFVVKTEYEVLYDPTLSNYGIITDSAVYSLKPAEKTYVKVESTDLQYNVILTDIQKLYKRQLFRINDDNIVKWVKVNNNQWKGQQDLNSAFVIMTFDPETLFLNLIETFMPTDGIDKKFSEELVTYEIIPIDAELLKIPAGYREVELEKN